MRDVVLTISLFGALAAGALTQPVSQQCRDMMDRIMQTYNAGDYAAISREFNADMTKAVPPDALRQFLEGLAQQFGKLVAVEPVRSVGPTGSVFLGRFEHGKQEIQLHLDDHGRIAGLILRPPRPEIPVPSRNETPLSFPLQGECLVFWGGDDKASNLHHDVPSQRFAFDFLAVDAKGATHRGDESKNEGFYVYGREVLAPADGVVTEAIDGVRENPPGTMNSFSALGNAVFIQHSAHEVSVLAHLIPGSVRVKVGDQVKRGQVIGLCGNSGNSSEPHLHYHLQNTPYMPEATGIKCTFGSLRVTRDGKTEVKQDYSPVKGELIAAP